MHYIFGIFRPLQINHVCDNFRPHGNSRSLSGLVGASDPEKKRSRPPSSRRRPALGAQKSQDHGRKGGLSLKGVAVMTETAMTAETAKTIKTATMPHCAVFCRTSKRRARCSPEPVLPPLPTTSTNALYIREHGTTCPFGVFSPDLKAFVPFKP